MKTVEFQTTWGTITLTLDDGGCVIAFDLPHLKNTPRKPFEAEFSKINDPKRRGKDASFFFQTLEKKFPNIGNPAGTEFQKEVWREMMQIPRGQTRTYGEIATAIGRPKAVRAVGSACGANPIPLFIPCHRVVAKNGLGGYGSGLPWKKLLLEMEGWNGGAVE
jgi:O-6-methylguanine DNA methyltransferase